MVLHDFISSLGKLEILTHVGLDDYADRLNFLFSVCFLMVFSGITTVKTYFLNPIFCYLPNIIGSHEGQSAYVNNYCYTEGTYNVALEDFHIDTTNKNWAQQYKGKKIYYYQWLPFLLGVQGVMFYIPRIVWHLFANFRTGSDLSQIIRVASDAGRAEGDKRDKLVRHVSKQLEMWVYNTREVFDSQFKAARRRLYNRLSVCLPSKRLGTWLVFVYFCVKCLYVANLVGQLLIMTKVLQLDSVDGSRNASLVSLTLNFGPSLLADLMNGKDWQHTGLFPRSGCCAVKLRQMAGANEIFAQCAIPVNMIHEKIFIFLWFWYVLVLLLTLFSILLWCSRILLMSRRSHLPKKYLYLAGVLSRKNEDEKKTVEDFVAKFLRHDGTLMLHMLALNCGDLVATDICAELYRSYKEFYQTQDLRGSDGVGEAVAFVVNASHSSVAMSPGNTKRRRRRSNSGCGGSDALAPSVGEKRRSNLYIEPSAPLIEESSAVNIQMPDTPL